MVKNPTCCPFHESGGRPDQSCVGDVEVDRRTYLKADIDYLVSLRVQVSRLAASLDLDVPGDADPMVAIEAEINRLLDIKKLWSQACDIAREHCSIEWGDSHIRDGIPKLRRERDRLQAEVNKLRERLQFDPGGSDKIDELEQALQFVNHDHELDHNMLVTIREDIERWLKVLPKERLG